MRNLFDLALNTIYTPGVTTTPPQPKYPKNNIDDNQIKMSILYLI